MTLFDLKFTLLLGGSLKKYSSINFKSIIIRVMLFLFIILLSMNGAYAFFTATATKRQSSMTTGVIKVGLEDTSMFASGQTSVGNIKILPGSTVQYSGSVKNTGNSDMYALLEFCVKIDNKEVQTNYYTALGTEIEKDQTGFITGSTPISVGKTQAFALTFTFDRALGNSYKNKDAQLIITARAIQKSNLSPIQATNHLLSSVTGGGLVDSLPSAYTRLEYLEGTGTQYIKLVSGTVDNSYGLMMNFSYASVNDGNKNDNYPAGFSTTNNKRFLFWGVFSNNWRYGWYNTSTGATTPYVSVSTCPTGLDNYYIARLNYLNDGTAYFNGTSGSITGYGTSFTNTDFYLFKSYTTCCSCRIKSAQLTKGNNIVADLIPAKRNSDGVLGMYDTINDVFYTNAGTGTFTAGAEVLNTADQGLVFSYNTFTQTYTLTDGTNITQSAITIPSSYDDGINGRHPVATIASGAFANCTTLESVQIPNSIKNIQLASFYGCTTLTDVDIQDGATSTQSILPSTFLAKYLNEQNDTDYGKGYWLVTLALENKLSISVSWDEIANYVGQKMSNVNSITSIDEGVFYFNNIQTTGGTITKEQLKAYLLSEYGLTSLTILEEDEFEEYKTTRETIIANYLTGGG